MLLIFAPLHLVLLPGDNVLREGEVIPQVQKNLSEVPVHVIQYAFKSCIESWMNVFHPLISISFSFAKSNW